MPLIRALIVATALSAPAWAEDFALTLPVRDVVVFPQAAQVSRAATVALPAGQHRITLHGLPAGTDADALRVRVDGARLVSATIQHGRPLPDGSGDSPAVAEARRALRVARQALADHDTQVAMIAAQAQAADDLAAYMLGMAAGGAATDMSLPNRLDYLENRLTGARRAAVEARARADRMAPDRAPLQRALEDAQAHLDAVLAPGGAGQSLVVAIDSTGEPALITVTATVADAGWRPVYDLHLDSHAPALRLDRGAVVAQNSGEDWADVSLTLSTARPTDRAAPTRIDPEIVAVFDAGAVLRRNRSLGAMAKTGAATPDAAPAYADVADPVSMGETVLWQAPAPATIRSGADAARLSLGTQALAPTIRAEAAPLFDTTAYLVAEAVNDTGQPLLPGQATLFADGAMVGQMQMPMAAIGATMEIGFGPIEGLAVARRTPARDQGETGLIRKASERREQVQIIAHNRTDRDWPLRITDRVPVSEQEVLRIDWQATPPPSAELPEARRGILIWDRPIAAGETQEITIDTTLRWPEGMALGR